MTWQVLKATVIGIEFPLAWKTSVQCDECRDVYRTQFWAFLKGDDRTKLASGLREAGWFVEGDHERHVCPQCQMNPNPLKEAI